MSTRNPIVIQQGSTPTTGWQRPSDWLPIPDIATGEEVIYILMAVYNVVGNFAAFKFAGAYAVDWDDGSALENIPSGVKAEHSYNWADVGDVTSEGFRQALIKITPQAGQNITLVDLQEFHTTAGTGNYSQYRDAVINIPNVSGINLILANNVVVYHKSIQRFWIKQVGALTDCYVMFANCYALQSVPLFNTSSVTNMYGMFTSCYALQSVPLFDTSSVANMMKMFQYCYSIQTVPLFDTSSVTTMVQMFQYCYSIQTVPLFDLSSAPDLTRMFYFCYALQSVPLFDTSNITNMYGMFWQCHSLQTVPLFDMSSITTLYAMFADCYALLFVSFTDLASATDISYIFIRCESLQGIILPNCKKSIDFKNNLMSATAIDALGTSVFDLSLLASQSVTVTGNYGAATMDTTIWTNKNWTIIN